MAKTRLIQEIEPQRLHQTGVLRSGNLPVSLKFISDRPWLPWQRKFGNFNGKLAKTRLIQEIEPQMLHQTGGFRVKQFAGVISIYTGATPVSMATKM